MFVHIQNGQDFYSKYGNSSFAHIVIRHTVWSGIPRVQTNSICLFSHFIRWDVRAFSALLFSAWINIHVNVSRLSAYSGRCFFTIYQRFIRLCNTIHSNAVILVFECCFQWIISFGVWISLCQFITWFLPFFSLHSHSFSQHGHQVLACLRSIAYMLDRVNERTSSTDNFDINYECTRTLHFIRTS